MSIDCFCQSSALLDPGSRAPSRPLTLNVDGREFAVSGSTATGRFNLLVVRPEPGLGPTGRRFSVWLTRPLTATDLDFRVTEPLCDAADTTQCHVPYNWSLIPRDGDGEPLVAQGKGFRLMFITSGASLVPSSTTVGAYNTFVQGKANAVNALKPMKEHFRAIVQRHRRQCSRQYQYRSRRPGQERQDLLGPTASRWPTATPICMTEAGITTALRPSIPPLRTARP